jgi:Membrane domain of glycerophosphoryl diester phosphodiesterase
VTVGGVLQQALGLYQRFFWRFALTTALVVVVLDLLTALGRTVDDSDGGAALWALLALMVGLVGTFLVQGALTLAVDDVRDGRIDTSIGELYARTRPHLGALIVAGVLAAIGIGLGLLLLIAPGLYLLTRWALIVPTIVLEGRSAGESFGRSNDLTEGHRWAVLGVALVTLLASAVISNIVISIFLAVLPDFLGVWLGSVVAHCVTTPFLALAWTVMYFDLRRAAEASPAAAVEPPAASA